MDYIETPSGLRLTDGCIVMLARFGSTKWVVHNGWYTYMGQQYSGWYFASIPAQTIIPVNEEDLRLVTLVSGGDSSYCPCPPGPGPGPCPPCPPGPGPGPGPQPIPPNMMWELDRAWISVETIAQRDKLNTRLIPNGKIVRVNNVMGVAKYYIYNQVLQAWEEEHFGIDTSNFVTTEEVGEIVDKAIESADITDKVEQVVESSNQVHDKVDSIIQETVPDMISQSTEEINNNVEEISNNVTNLTQQVTNISEVVDSIPEWSALT